MKKQNSLTSQRNCAGNDSSPGEVKKRILVVDDDPGIQDIFTIIFEKAGYAIEIKKDGEDVLKNKFTFPDLFLVDKQLSGYSGLDVCRHLKSQEQTKDIPVVMISAAPDIGALSQQAGADSYIEKPFEIKDLLKVVNFYVYQTPLQRSQA